MKKRRKKLDKGTETRRLARNSGNDAALKDLIRAAIALNLKGKGKPKPRRTSSKRAG